MDKIFVRDLTVMTVIGTRPDDGAVVALGYQATGGAFIYRRSIAKDVFGTDDPAVVAEAIQTILRREEVEGAYELLKGLTRTNEKVTRESIDRFIDELPVSDAVKAEMHVITPENYTGYSF